jgi:adenylate kinase family enzyme
MKRIAVIGSTGSGKTTLARRIGAILGIPHIELDALHWQPNWTPTSGEAFRGAVDDATCGERWVIDGNYSAVRDIVWPRADALVWLDYPLPLIMSRLARRTADRIVRKTELWSGNRERLGNALSRDSLFLWALQYHRVRRPLLPAEFALPEHQHLTVHHLRSPRQTRVWLRDLETSRSTM